MKELREINIGFDSTMLPEGADIALFSEADNAYNLIADYLVEGLKGSEQVYYLCDAESHKKIIGYLQQKSPGLPDYIKKGALLISRMEKIYCPKGYFNVGEMQESLKELYDKALKESYQGLRIASELTWLDRKPQFREEFERWQKSAPGFLQKQRITLLSYYDLSRTGDDGLEKAGKLHRFRIIGGKIFKNINVEPQPASPTSVMARQISETFKDSNEFLLELINSIPDMFTIKDKNLKYLLVNQAFCKFVNKSPSSIYGRTDEEIFEPTEANLVKARDLEALERRQSTLNEVSVKQPNGEERHFISRRSVCMDSDHNPVLINLARDITLKKIEDQKLRLVSSALDFAGSGIVITDMEGNIIWANKTVPEMTGYALEELIGKNPRIFKSGLFNDYFYRMMWQTILAGSTWKGEIVNRRKDGSLYNEELIITPVKIEGKITNFIAVKQDVSDRKKMEKELLLIHSAMEGSLEGILITDGDGKPTYVNKTMKELFGYGLEELAAGNSFMVELKATTRQELNRNTADKKGFSGEVVFSCANGEKRNIYVRQPFTMDPFNMIPGFLYVFEDITEKKRELEKRNMIEIQLNQAQKLESIGRLAAGIAHEINTPIQFIGDNTRFIDEMYKDLDTLILNALELTEKAQAAGFETEIANQIKETADRIDIDFVRKELPTALQQTQEGIKRVAEIVRAMKEFSHPGTSEKKLININKAVQNTVTVARNEWKYVADIVLNLEENLPPVSCYPGDLNQVILNILINASHAISSIRKTKPDYKGTITISTLKKGNFIRLSIRDSGTGIPDEIKDKIYDPFFTTKEVGVGTGQGLAISYDTIVNKHNGHLSFETELGKGTVFHIDLPLDT